MTTRSPIQSSGGCGPGIYLCISQICPLWQSGKNKDVVRNPQEARWKQSDM